MSIIKPHILAMSAYKPPLEGRSPKSHTLLDFNERTIPVSQPVVQALQSFITDGRLQQYPAYGDILSRLAAYTGAKAQQIMITNGSDQGIDLIFRAVAKPDAEAIIPGPSFAMYNQCANIEAMTLIEPQYNKESGYPVEEVLASITPNTAIIVVSNPNNPCGTIVSQDVILRLAKAAPHAAILVDECYYEYSRQTVVPFIKGSIKESAGDDASGNVGEGSGEKLSNIFVTRTFSKTWGIPSLRFGYLIAAAEYVDALCNIRGPYDINQLAVVAAEAALDNPDYTDSYVTEVMEESKPLLEQYFEESSIEYWSSSANYLWAFPDNAEAINTYLIEKAFLVRPKMYQDKLGLRITVGTVSQIKELIQAFRDFS